MDLRIVPLAEDDLPIAFDLLLWAFGADADPGDLDAERSVFEFDRSLAAWDGHDLVGCLSTWSFDLSIPGGELPAAGTTWVSVAPTHRRRGILRSLMSRHLTDAWHRGDPLAALWASEASIYGRFGYGMAVERLMMTLDLRNLQWSAQAVSPEVTVHRLLLDHAEEVLDPIYEQARQRRPGLHRRSRTWWHYQVLSTRKDALRGANHKFVAVAECDDEPIAYAVYGIDNSSSQGQADNTVVVIEMAGVDTAAETAMWRYLTAHDLATSLKASMRPVDDPLPWLVTDMRHARREVGDSLWVRILDLPRVLSARSWAESIALTIEVRDDVVSANAGCWRLETSADGASCERTDGPPDVSLDVRELGAVYLGGIALSRLVKAGLVDVYDWGALDALDGALRIPEAPWAPEIW